MTNALEEVARLEVQDPENMAWHDLGFAVIETSPRTGLRGAIEVRRGSALTLAAAKLLRSVQMSIGTPAAVQRWRITLADGGQVEGPFSLETFASRERPIAAAGFELLISCAGELEERPAAEADPVAAAAKAERQVIALGEGATSAVQTVALTLIKSRPPEMPLDDALSAVLAGGLTGLVGTMRAADPTATLADIEEAVRDGLAAILGALADD